AYALPACLAFALLILGVALGHLPQLAALGLLGLPLATLTIVSAHTQRLSLAIVGAVLTHLGTTALLVVAFLIQGFF
ncbi:MAG: hypothetical protein H0T73_02075, partial [Ardenticatenales bacterium]|nr:hypothetical protein [Ardenticatenales bacterium]